MLVYAHMCNVLNRINCIKIKACAFISELRYSRGGVIVNAGESDSTRMAISLRCTPLRCTPREKKDRRAILFERYPCPFFSGLHAWIRRSLRPRTCICYYSSSKERLDAGDKLAIYLTGNHHGALHVLRRVNRRFI